MDNRWKKLDTKLRENFSLQVTRWKASTPNNLIDKFNPTLKPTECACAQSHVNIWRHIVNQGLPYALILEDDACFRKDWLEQLGKITKQIEHEDWHGIFLNVTEKVEPAETWVKAKNQYLAGGYILSNKGARIILQMFKDLYFSADWMTLQLQSLRQSYTYFPWLIIQEGRDSTLRDENAVDADHKKVVRILSEANYSLNNYK